MAPKKIIKYHKIKTVAILLPNFPVDFAASKVPEPSTSVSRSGPSPKHNDKKNPYHQFGKAN